MLPGFNRPRLTRESTRTVLLHQQQNRLQRILSATGKTIHDVINCPISRNLVTGYYKVSRTIDRRAEILDLEHQWNRR